MAKVFLGVGHGGKDPGAVANGLKEKDLNLSVALACQEELERHGVSVLMSRTGDDSEALSARIKECNAFNPDLAGDIHCNAGGGDGAEVFYSHNGGTGKTLANNILAEFVEIGQNSRGAKTKLNSKGDDYFGFIRQTDAPAVIVECAFLDNKKDVQIIDTADEQKKIGVAIAKGFLKTLGISYKAEKEEAKKSVAEIAKEVIAGKWGNGEDRKNRLRNAGYDPAEVQKMVNELVSNTPKKPVKKTVSQIADEVIAGKWGVGAYRKKRLTLAGYDYKAVQKEVNRKLR